MEETEEEGREWLVENLHSAIHGHGFVVIETTWESFRQYCRLHAKWKVYFSERQRVWQCSKWPLYGQQDIKGCSKSPLRVKS